MLEAIIAGLGGLVVGFKLLFVNWQNLIMLGVGGVLLWLGIKKDCEPLLLVPIGFGCILVNIPLSDVMRKDGFIRTIYDAGIDTELFPLLDLHRHRRDDGLRPRAGAALRRSCWGRRGSSGSS